MSVELVQHDNDSLCFHSYMRIHFTLNICWRRTDTRILSHFYAPGVTDTRILSHFYAPGVTDTRILSHFYAPGVTDTRIFAYVLVVVDRSSEVKAASFLCDLRIHCVTSMFLLTILIYTGLE
jgi:hypothetical protein